MSVKYPNYVNLTSSSEEQPNERTPSPPPRKKSLSPPQAPSKSISSKSTHYTSSSSPNESSTPTHVAPPSKLCFVILIKQEPQKLPYVSTMDNWPPGPSNPSPPPRVSLPPPSFPNPPPGFEPLPSTQPLFVNINNNAPPLENIHNPPPNPGNQDFPNSPNILDFVHPNGMPHLHNMVCQCCSTTRHETHHTFRISRMQLQIIWENDISQDLGFLIFFFSSLRLSCKALMPNFMFKSLIMD
ncbi:hypothetical protein Tco_0822383 [Tanacetum coccineum]|uniref:Uncharacterized protein n=1 Tax=Tanacetum coccineum TaxID=301880 RepID=A0ABQ5AJE3_9ASTR